MPAVIQKPSSRIAYARVSSGAAPAPRAPQLSRMNSLLIAFLVALSLLAVAYWVRLPSLVGAAFYLFFAVESDLRTSRIPNWLNGSALLGALTLSFALGGGNGLVAAGLGATTALVPAILLYSTGLLGAGDAKGIAVLGALYGPLEVPGLYLWMILSGAILSIGLLVVRGELREFLERWGDMAKPLLFSGRLVYAKPEAGSAAAGGIPFALCMALGSLAQPIWGWP